MTTLVIAPNTVTEPVLVGLADDIAGRTKSATGSLQRLYEVTSPHLTEVVSGWVAAELVDDVLVRTYVRVWRSAHHRPRQIPIRSWLAATALRCAAAAR